MTIIVFITEKYTSDECKKKSCMEAYMDDRVLKIVYAADLNKRFVMSGSLQICAQRKSWHIYNLLMHKENRVLKIICTNFISGFHYLLRYKYFFHITLKFSQLRAGYY
jgi:pyrimidine deaminase RibD-like protein